MADFHHQEEGLPGTSGGEHGAPPSRLARILVVEDNDDVRQMIAVALQIRGYSVAVAGDAEQALRHLRAGRFDVVLSDYELPDKTGATMLREAAGAGLLGSASAFIVTAYTQPDEADGFEVIRKPINLDRLMSQVQRVLGASGKVAPSPLAVAGGAAPDLVLYVSAGSAASARARRTMERTLRAFAGSPVRYAVCDVGEEPAKAEEDQIAFTPTLVKRSPGTRAWVLGDLADAAVVIDLLKTCGLKPST